MGIIWIIDSFDKLEILLSSNCENLMLKGELLLMIKYVKSTKLMKYLKLKNVD